MKRVLKIIFALLLCIISNVNAANIWARDVKISVTPIESKIYIDGNYVGDGVVTIKLKRSDGFVSVRCENPGYIPVEAKVYYSDKRKAIAYDLRPDTFLEVSEPSGLSNQYFTVEVADNLITKDSSGERNTELVWKMIHQVILNYFDEISTSDKASGFVQTPWIYESIPIAEKQLRTRVSVKETNLGGDLTFQVKVSSEVAPIGAAKKDNHFTEVDRISREFAPIISEFQSRLGDL